MRRGALASIVAWTVVFGLVRAAAAQGRTAAGAAAPTGRRSQRRRLQSVIVAKPAACDISDGTYYQGAKLVLQACPRTVPYTCPQQCAAGLAMLGSECARALAVAEVRTAAAARQATDRIAGLLEACLTGAQGVAGTAAYVGSDLPGATAAPFYVQPEHEEAQTAYLGQHAPRREAAELAYEPPPADVNTLQLYAPPADEPAEPAYISTRAAGDCEYTTVRPSDVEFTGGIISVVLENVALRVNVTVDELLYLNFEWLNVTDTLGVGDTLLVSGPSSSSSGALIGGVVGAVVAVMAALAGGGYYVYRRRKARSAAPPPPPESGGKDVPPAPGWSGVAGAPAAPAGGGAAAAPAMAASGAAATAGEGELDTMISHHLATFPEDGFGSLPPGASPPNPAGRLERTPTQQDEAGYSSYESAATPTVDEQRTVPSHMLSTPSSTATGSERRTFAGNQSSAAASAALLSQDVLLSYIQSQKALPAVVPSPLLPRASGGVDAHRWELQFDELEIMQPIGEGSFGRVYLASWHQTPVAVKILIDKDAMAAVGVESALSLPPSVLSKLDDEAGLLASLRHPCVVQFMGICLQPPAIITEFCPKGSLTAVLMAARKDPAAAGALTWARRLGMAHDAALGMLYLHTRSPPIIHRDLKSPNLLVNESFRIKVTDFNLSKFVEDNMQSRSSSMAAMNPRWLAPEVMRGERATAAADVFSFGVVMWELLTWELPWSSTGSWQLVNLLLAGGRLEVPPRAQLPGPDTATFRGLDAYISLLKRCWAQEAVERPTFEEIIPALRALQDSAS